MTPPFSSSNDVDRHVRQRAKDRARREQEETAAEDAAWQQERDRLAEEIRAAAARAARALGATQVDAAEEFVVVTIKGGSFFNGYKKRHSRRSHAAWNIGSHASAWGLDGPGRMPVWLLSTGGLAIHGPGSGTELPPEHFADALGPELRERLVDLADHPERLSQP